MVERKGLTILEVEDVVVVTGGWLFLVVSLEATNSNASMGLMTSPSGEEPAEPCVML